MFLELSFACPPRLADQARFVLDHELSTGQSQINANVKQATSLMVVM
jgi:hypothetical protein